MGSTTGQAERTGGVGTKQGDTSNEVLAAVLKLLNDERFQDVAFRCSDGRVVCSNRAFLAARCEYFCSLLYGPLLEGRSNEISLQANAAAVQHIIHHLHTGSYASIEQEGCGMTLMEICNLAQQYILPAIVQHIADRLLTDLQPQQLGMALSYALKAGLSPVIKSIWVAMPRLLPRPLAFDSSFSAEAICFCLQHTSWLTPPHSLASEASTGSSSSSSSKSADAVRPTADGHQNQNQHPANAGSATLSSSSSCDLAFPQNMHSTGSSSVMREEEAFNAVLAWMMHQVEGCPDCQQTRQHKKGSSTAYHQQQANTASHSGSSSSSNSFRGAAHPAAGWSASGSRSVPSSPCKPIQPMQQPGNSCSNTRHNSAAGTAAGGAGSDSDSDGPTTPATATSSTGNATAGAVTATSVSKHSSTAYEVGCAAWPDPCGAVSITRNKAGSSGSGGGGSAPARGHCCGQHERMLLALLARLNWHLLSPLEHGAMEQLEGLGLLGPAALLDVYRVSQRCSHMALWGSFPSLMLQASERGLRCYTTQGEQVLECESAAHITAAANLSFTAGKHCWQFVVLAPCDLVWIGVGDGSLTPDVWGGKQAGGWFYGSNDALCHDKHSDRHAYDKHCGHGSWPKGAVVDVCLDMDAREVWFAVDGAQPRLGFSDLPERVYPAVSLRAPAQLLVRFRASSWLMAG